MSFKGFSIFSSDGHFIQRSETILAILVKELQGNICVKLFWNWSSSLGGDVLWMNCWRHTTDDGRLATEDGHRVITIAHLEHLVLRWAKNRLIQQIRVKESTSIQWVIHLHVLPPFLQREKTFVTFYFLLQMMKLLKKRVTSLGKEFAHSHEQILSFKSWPLVRRGGGGGEGGGNRKW